MIYKIPFFHKIEPLNTKHEYHLDSTRLPYNPIMFSFPGKLMLYTKTTLNKKTYKF